MRHVLIHGAGGSAWDWHLVAAELGRRGHEVVAPDLPCDDDSAGLAEYADTVVEAAGTGSGVVVAHSFGAFVAPLVCDRVSAELLVLVAPMIPSPGESAGEWWDNTGQAEAQRAQAQQDGRPAEGDVAELFFHDISPELAAEALEHEREQSGTPFEEPWPLAAWPEVPTKVLLCRDDRLFPPSFQRRIARERLGITPDEMAGGHYVPISRPRELAERLQAYVGSL